MSSVGLIMLVQQLPERRFSSALSVSPCSAGPGLVVVIGGEADWTTADQLREELAAALAYGPRSAVLDLTDLVFCNLRGLAALLEAVEVARRSGTDVTLRGMSRQLTWLHASLLSATGRSGAAWSGYARGALAVEAVTASAHPWESADTA